MIRGFFLGLWLEKESADFTRLAANMLIRQWKDLEFGGEFGWESKELSGAILGMMVDMTQSLKNSFQEIRYTVYKIRTTILQIWRLIYND